MSQNLERVKQELESLGAEYKSILKRFKYVTLPFMKSRVSQEDRDAGIPRNNEFFHLLVSFVEEFYDKAPRVATYRDICVLVLGAGAVGVLVV